MQLSNYSLHKVKATSLSLQHNKEQEILLTVEYIAYKRLPWPARKAIRDYASVYFTGSIDNWYSIHPSLNANYYIDAAKLINSNDKYDVILQSLIDSKLKVHEYLFFNVKEFLQLIKRNLLTNKEVL